MKCIELTRGCVAIVDDEDFDQLAQWRWSIDAQGYVYRTDNRVRKGHRVSMAASVLAPKPGLEIDHRNGNKCDNRRSNLRHATDQQQSANRPKRSDNKTGFKGVEKNGGGWTARIRKGDIRKNLGTFRTPEAAHIAYQKAAIELHGEFARFN